jgi:hypothetical protein
MKMRPVGPEFFSSEQAGGRKTDRHDEAVASISRTRLKSITIVLTLPYRLSSLVQWDGSRTFSSAD